MPSQSLRIATMPITAAKMIRTPRMPQTRTVLSFEPNSRIAKFLTAAGELLMESSPTALTGCPMGDARMAATSWATPSATSAVTIPTIVPPTISAPRPVGPVPVSAARGVGGRCS